MNTTQTPSLKRSEKSNMHCDTTQKWKVANNPWVGGGIKF